MIFRNDVWPGICFFWQLNKNMKHGMISTAGYLGRLLILQVLGRYWGNGFWGSYQEHTEFWIIEHCIIGLSPKFTICPKPSSLHTYQSQQTSGDTVNQPSLFSLCYCICSVFYPTLLFFRWYLPSRAWWNVISPLSTFWTTLREFGTIF